MEHSWTYQTKQNWATRRNQYRKESGLKPFDELSEGERDIALNKEKNSLVKRLKDYAVKTKAWPLHKSPIAEFRAPISGQLLLPTHYREAGESNKIAFVEGDDLHLVVYKHYQEKVDANYPGINYVSSDGLCSKRHEYLGPLPLVSGYNFTFMGRMASIEWHDGTLQDNWMNNTTWKLEVYYDPEVEGWLSKPRGDYTIDLDTVQYVGLDP